MGRLLRATERVRQAIGWARPPAALPVPSEPSTSECAPTSLNFGPTTNARNNLMVAEARHFSARVHQLHGDLSTWVKHLGLGLYSLQSMLEVSLPRAFDDPTPALGLGPRPTDCLSAPLKVGRSVKSADLTTALQQLQQQLQEGVLAPLEKWLAAFTEIKKHNERAEALRLDLDAQLRTVSKLQVKAEAVQSRQDSVAEKALFKLQTSLDKTARLHQRYTLCEAEVFNALVTLVRDAHLLQDLVIGALYLAQNLFSNSLKAFDMSIEPRVQTLPQHVTPEALNPPGLKPWVPKHVTTLEKLEVTTPILIHNVSIWRSACKQHEDIEQEHQEQRPSTSVRDTLPYLPRTQNSELLMAAPAGSATTKHSRPEASDCSTSSTPRHATFYARASAPAGSSEIVEDTSGTSPQLHADSAAPPSNIPHLVVATGQPGSASAAVHAVHAVRFANAHRGSQDLFSNRFQVSDAQPLSRQRIAALQAPPNPFGPSANPFAPGPTSAPLSSQRPGAAHHPLRTSAQQQPKEHQQGERARRKSQQPHEKDKQQQLRGRNSRGSLPLRHSFNGAPEAVSPQDAMMGQSKAGGTFMSKSVPHHDAGSSQAVTAGSSNEPLHKHVAKQAAAGSPSQHPGGAAAVVPRGSSAASSTTSKVSHGTGSAGVALQPMLHAGRYSEPAFDAASLEGATTDQDPLSSSLRSPVRASRLPPAPRPPQLSPFVRQPPVGSPASKGTSDLQVHNNPTAVAGALDLDAVDTRNPFGPPITPNESPEASSPQNLNPWASKAKRRKGSDDGAAAPQPPRGRSSDVDEDAEDEDDGLCFRTPDALLVSAMSSRTRRTNPFAEGYSPHE